MYNLILSRLLQNYITTLRKNTANTTTRYRTIEKRRIPSRCRHPRENMDYETWKASVSSLSLSLSCSAHLVILSRAWSFLRFPSPEVSAGALEIGFAGCEEEEDRKTRARNGKYIHGGKYRTCPICFRWVMSRFAYRNCPRGCEAGFARKQTKWEGWHLDTTSVLNLRRQPIRRRD